MTQSSGTATFEKLFRAEFPTMFRLATLLGAADPENVAAEAFVRLHDHWDSLTDPARAGGYVRTTVLNLCRSAGRHNVVADRYAATQPVDDVVSSAEAVALQSISDASLLAALDGLAMRHREALVLRFWLDLSESQMAEAMGCSAGSVKSHVSRGLSALRSALDHKGDFR